MVGGGGGGLGEAEGGKDEDGIGGDGSLGRFEACKEGGALVVILALLLLCGAARSGEGVLFLAIGGFVSLIPLDTLVEVELEGRNLRGPERRRRGRGEERGWVYRSVFLFSSITR